jgi:hypothetical protein
MASQAVKIVAKQTAFGRAREAWEDHAGDYESAATALYETIMGDKQLMKEILPQVLLNWCHEMIRGQAAQARGRIVPSTLDATQGGARLRAVIGQTLFDFPLPGGKRLGDANGEEIGDAAAGYRQQADTLGHRARWLAAVAEKVGRSNRAEGSLSLAQLEELLEAARADD